jgi:hypothetical protein
MREIQRNSESKIGGDYWVRIGVENYPTNDMVGKETKKTTSERWKTTITGDVCEVVGRYGRYKKGWNGLEVTPFL